MLIQLLFTNPLLFLILATSILLAISLHEYFHAWMAYYLGDKTAQKQGRLTVNPLAHLDPLGTTLLFTVGMGWGKPVPFNPLNIRNHKWGESLVGIAGIASNLVMAVVVGLVLRFVIFSNPSLVFFLSYFVWINLILAIFNLIPIPPLDGSHLLLALPTIPNSAKRFLIQNSTYLIIILMVFLMRFGLSPIIGPLFKLITGSSSIIY